MTKKRPAILIAVLAGGRGGWEAYGYLKLPGLGLVSRLIDPIHPPRQVNWDSGPNEVAAPNGP